MQQQLELRTWCNYDTRATSKELCFSQTICPGSTQSDHLEVLLLPIHTVTFRKWI